MTYLKYELLFETSHFCVIVGFTAFTFITEV